MLIAGTHTRALDLVAQIEALMKPAVLNMNWHPILHEAIKRQKQVLAEEYVNAALGMSYSEFIDKGKEKLPEDVFREMLYQISRKDFDCSLILAAFSQTTPHLFRIQDTGLIENCEHFAAIGTGLYIAESVLFQRSQNTDDSLGNTIYNVFEAMWMGSNAPGVSDKFRIHVAQWEYDCTGDEENPTNSGAVKRSLLKREYYDFLKAQFGKYGPKEVGTVDFKADLVETIEPLYLPTPEGRKAIRELHPEKPDPWASRTATKKPASVKGAGK